MRIVFFIAGLLTFVAGLIVFSSIRSDSQVQIVTILWVGSVLMFGQAAILSGQKWIKDMVDEAQRERSRERGGPPP